ncbi:MAG TPA: hypothetical protein VET88_06810 [Gammaproteobacteria bacterium]|nr:hypothetical protein [Gammaproteobacteria bacterium]
MLAFSHKFTFGLCVSVALLTAVVVASVALTIYKQQDNAMLLQRIDSLKTENAALREQVRQFATTQANTRQRDLTQPGRADTLPAGSVPASDS